MKLTEFISSNTFLKRESVNLPEFVHQNIGPFLLLHIVKEVKQGGHGEFSGKFFVISLLPLLEYGGQLLHPGVEDRCQPAITGSSFFLSIAVSQREETPAGQAGVLWDL